MKKDSNKGDTMKFQYVITTQNLEEYGENFHKFKGGSTYVVGATLSKEIYEKDAYGEGEHSYYEVPSVTEASVAAEVMKHVNKYNGLSGSFDYITDIDKVYFLLDYKLGKTIVPIYRNLDFGSKLFSTEA